VHAAHDLVMVHEQHAIDRGMDVQLDGVGAAGLGRPERGPRVFELVARGAPVRDDERAAHLSRLSAFFPSIQPGSFSIACTVS